MSKETRVVYATRRGEKRKLAKFVLRKDGTVIVVPERLQALRTMGNFGPNEGQDIKNIYCSVHPSERSEDLNRINFHTELRSGERREAATFVRGLKRGDGVAHLFSYRHGASYTKIPYTGLGKRVGFDFSKCTPIIHYLILRKGVNLPDPYGRHFRIHEVELGSFHFILLMNFVLLPSLASQAVCKLISPGHGGGI